MSAPAAGPAALPSYGDVVARIAEITSLAPARLVPDAVLFDLVSDSLVLVEVAIDLQEEFDVVLFQTDLRDVRTVGDLVELIRRRLQEGP